VSPRAWKALALVAGAVVALNFALDRVDRALGTPGGPRSSSYATAADGAAAYAELLRRAGHPVVRLRTPPAEAGLDPRTTVVLLDPGSLDRDDAEELARFAEDGGRLVAGGRSRLLADLLEKPPDWSASGAERARPVAPVAELAGVRDVRASGPGSWSATGEALPALADRDSTLLAVAAPGAGRALLLANSSPLQNRLLGRADNAALGLGLAGEAGRPVLFVETVHGYGLASGLAAIPDRWLWVLGGLLVAALTWMLARGRRLGPPERERRELPPPRRAYVEALGAALARTRSPAAAGEVVLAAIRTRHGEPGDAVRDDEGLVAAGRVLARRERGAQ
jgi:hypothetical protein